MVNRETRLARAGPRAARGRGFRAAFPRPARLARARAASYVARMLLASLREQLTGYQPTGETEAGFLARMLELTEHGAACERTHFEPGHFTASAFVLSPDKRDVVLIHHKKLGIWVQPGGHVEETDSDLASAARREVLEEVGLAELEPFPAGDSALFDIDIHDIPARKTEPAHQHFDVRFAFVARTRDLRQSEEVTDLRWVPLGEVERMGSDASVMRAVHKLRRLLG